MSLLIEAFMSNYFKNRLASLDTREMYFVHGAIFASLTPSGEQLNTNRIVYGARNYDKALQGGSNIVKETSH
jgi:hypothetical protein